MSINANSSGSLTRATPPTDFSFCFWWKWIGTPTAVFHIVYSVDNNLQFCGISTDFNGGTPLFAAATSTSQSALIDPGLNWVCLAGVDRGANGSTSTFLARFENERYWSKRVTIVSANLRAGDLFYFDESALDEPSTAVMKGCKIWSEVKTDNMLLRESFQLDPVDSTALWSYPELRSVAGAGRDMRSTGRAFTPAGTFVADGREPPVREQFTRQTGWLRGGLRA